MQKEVPNGEQSNWIGHSFTDVTRAGSGTSGLPMIIANELHRSRVRLVQDIKSDGGASHCNGAFFAGVTSRWGSVITTAPSAFAMLGVDFAIKTDSVVRTAHLIAVCADLEWLVADRVSRGDHVEVGCAETLTIAAKAVAVATLVARWIGAVMVPD